MPQNSNPDFKKKYPNIQAGTLVPMSIKDIFCRTLAFKNTSRTHIDIISGKQLKTIIIVAIYHYAL